MTKLVSTLPVEGAESRLTLAATEIIIDGDRERLISLQDIQSEIDATQAEAWQDLVRVLTHEIMNSITPVTSLAQTAAELVDDVVRETGPESPFAEELEDVQSAVSTVARRSDSLLQFIDGIYSFRAREPFVWTLALERTYSRRLLRQIARDAEAAAGSGPAPCVRPARHAACRSRGSRPRCAGG